MKTMQERAAGNEDVDAYNERVLNRFHRARGLEQARKEMDEEKEKKEDPAEKTDKEEEDDEETKKQKAKQKAYQQAKYFPKEDDYAAKRAADTKKNTRGKLDAILRVVKAHKVPEIYQGRLVM